MNWLSVFRRARVFDEISPSARTNAIVHYLRASPWIVPGDGVWQWLISFAVRNATKACDLRDLWYLYPEAKWNMYMSFRRDVLHNWDLMTDREIYASADPQQIASLCAQCSPTFEESRSALNRLEDFTPPSYSIMLRIASEAPSFDMKENAILAGVELAQSLNEVNEISSFAHSDEIEKRVCIRIAELSSDEAMLVEVLRRAGANSPAGRIAYAKLNPRKPVLEKASH